MFSHQNWPDLHVLLHVDNMHELHAMPIDCAPVLCFKGTTTVLAADAQCDHAA